MSYNFLVIKQHYFLIDREISLCAIVQPVSNKLSQADLSEVSLDSHPLSTTVIWSCKISQWVFGNCSPKVHDSSDKILDTDQKKTLQS